MLGREGNESIPLAVEGSLVGKRVTSMGAGDSHMVTLTSEGQVYSWGTYKDSNGYIGYAPGKEKASTPTLVPNLPTIKAIASGSNPPHPEPESGPDHDPWP